MSICLVGAGSLLLLLLRSAPDRLSSRDKRCAVLKSSADQLWLLHVPEESRVYSHWEKVQHRGTSPWVQNGHCCCLSVILFYAPCSSTSMLHTIIDLFHSYGLPSHSYADDTKSFTAVNANQRDSHNTLHCIENCLFEFRKVMDANYLKLNNEKTEVVSFRSR